MAGRNRQLKTPNGKIGAWISKSPAKSQAAWKQDTLEGLDKGSRVWYKAGVNSWVLGTLQALHVGLWTVALDSEAGEGTGQASTFSNTFPVALIAETCRKVPGPYARSQASPLLGYPFKIMWKVQHLRTFSVLQVISCKPELLVPANPVILDGVPDLTGLTYLNEPSILHGLNLRYSEDLIYTHAGPGFIAINPFKQVRLALRDIHRSYLTAIVVLVVFLK